MDTTPEAINSTSAITEFDIDEIVKNRPPGWQAPKNVPLEKIIELRSKGLTLSEVGQLLGITKQAVFARLHALEIEQENIEEFKRSRADYLAGMQLRLISSLTPADIQKMPGGSRILAACQLYDKERLERGLSTNNNQMIVLQVPRSEEEYKKIIENQKVVNPENEENTV